MRLLLKPLELKSFLKAINIDYFFESSFIEINSVGALNDKKKYMLTYSNNDVLSNENQSIIFAPPGSIDSPWIIKVNNPRLSFAIALNFIIKNKGLKKISSQSLSNDISLGSNVKIGNGVIIGKNVKIGDNVIINDFVEIGDDCIIKSGAIIGEDGFGFERDSFNTPIRIPHIGNVLLENNVEVGSMVTINRSTLKTTIIKKNVKIDDHAHIAHNVIVDEDTLICAGAVLGGSCYVGKRCWIGLNSTIHQNVKISDEVTVGMGANVFKSIKKGQKVAGFPSKFVPKIID